MKPDLLITVKPGWHDRVYEDFEVGDHYQHPVGRTITQTDHIWFTLLTVSNNAIHFESVSVARTEFKKLLADSTLALAIVTGLSVSDISQNAVNLGWDEARLSCPVFDGDPLYSQSLF